MRHLLIIVLCISSLRAIGQDKIMTRSGEITIHPVLHGSLVMEYMGTTLYVDPYGGAARYTDFPNADLILITDIHGDHLNKSTLSALATENTHFIVPAAVAEQIKGVANKAIEIIATHENTIFNDIEITAIPMYNLPETADSRHPKGRGNGYLIKMDHKTIYISGDTEDIVEMRNLKNIDIAFICMNEPYTMTVSQAAEAVLAFKPVIVYPYHYRGKDGLADLESFRSTVTEGNEAIEVRLRNWYPEN